MKRTPRATSVLQRRARKCLFLQVFQKPEKACRTQDGYMGSCPLSCLPGWQKTPERKICCTVRGFCRNTSFWRVLQQRISTPEHTECSQFPGSWKSFLENNPVASEELKKGNQHAGPHYKWSTRRYGTQSGNVPCLQVVLYPFRECCKRISYHSDQNPVK